MLYPAWGMEDVTRGRYEHTTGILNGIDMREWDPSCDRYLQTYSPPVAFSAAEPGGTAAARCTTA